ncbi:sigma-70 family RNA polymerase sigma factor [Pseudalkalibacillus salsuginis]|uniref:sigma-70 family RNA polymerase sigma factor n=1 Tax=Pseudalkalibacillus salsuginis TaxID=2910972 RepID=UPI001F17DC0F|nr:sigma-70 family RNA polymerase sigma factor [Pseudalkalibacillus salsuginis]MCF6411365.1 RNA polymerase sigma factor [Pseudalkalibacillus salsuginis]
MSQIIELVNEAKQGNDQAFLELFQKYEIDIYRTAYLYVKNQDDALDVVQETAYRSFKKINTLKNPEFFKTWLIKITMSCALDLLRKQQKVIHLNPKYTDNIRSKDEDIPLSISLQELIETLNENEKQIVLLKYYYGYKLNEIAEIVESPLGTVKSVLYRGLDKLRKKVRKDDVYEQ